MFDDFGKVLAFYLFVFCAIAAFGGFALARWVF